MASGTPPPEPKGAPLRTRPPEYTLRWLVTELDAVDIVTVEALCGGSTSAMHHVTLLRPDQTTVTVVMRRYVLTEILTA